MAQWLNDVIFRRTALSTAGLPDEAILVQCTNVMGHELGLSTGRVWQEVHRSLRLSSGGMPMLQSSFESVPREVSPWPVRLYNKPVLKQRKLKEITALLEPTDGLHCPQREPLSVTEKDLNANPSGFKAYSPIDPIVWAFSKLGILLFFWTGYMLMPESKPIVNRNNIDLSTLPMPLALEKEVEI